MQSDHTIYLFDTTFPIYSPVQAHKVACWTTHATRSFRLSYPAFSDQASHSSDPERAK